MDRYGDRGYGEKASPTSLTIRDPRDREMPEAIGASEAPAYKPPGGDPDATPEQKIKESEKTLQASNEKFRDGVTMPQLYKALNVGDKASPAEKTDAIKAFQDKHNLKNSGKIDSATLEALDRETGDDRSFSTRSEEAGRAKESEPSTLTEKPSKDDTKQTVEAGHERVPVDSEGVKVNVGEQKTVEAGHGRAPLNSNGDIQVSVGPPPVTDGATKKQESDTPVLSESTSETSSTAEAAKVAEETAKGSTSGSTTTPDAGPIYRSIRGETDTPQEQSQLAENQKSNIPGGKPFRMSSGKEEENQKSNIPGGKPFRMSSGKEEESSDTTQQSPTRSITGNVPDSSGNPTEKNYTAKGTETSTENAAKNETEIKTEGANSPLTTESDTYTPESRRAIQENFQASSNERIGEVLSKNLNENELKDFKAATEGKSFGETIALANSIEGVNKDELTEAVSGAVGYKEVQEMYSSQIKDPNLDENTRKTLSDMRITGDDMSADDLLKMDKLGKDMRANQTSMDEKLHGEHVAYLSTEQQNIVTEQPPSYIDMTDKSVDEKMDVYNLSPAVQERMRFRAEELTAAAGNDAVAGSNTPYLAKSFEGANMAELGNTSEAHTGDLRNGLPGKLQQTYFNDFLGGGRALRTEIDTTTGRSVIPGIGELVYPSGQEKRGEDSGIRITDPNNRYGAPVGSVISLQDARSPVYKPGADGVMKEIGYINSPDPQLYGGDGKFVGKDPFEKPMTLDKDNS